jgi:deoxyribose-phosphate aldolase
MELRRHLEGTLLGHAATEAAVRALSRNAVDLDIRGVCVPPDMVDVARKEAALRRAADTRTPLLITVANFPAGDSPTARVCAEVEMAAAAGAAEIDVVAPLAAIEAGDWACVRAFYRDVVAEAGAVPVKAILETAAFGSHQVQAAGGAAIDGWVSWLKTSTGFHPAGGATVDSVRLLAAVGRENGVLVKASGGIRDRAAAVAMVEAGAHSIGTSAVQAILGAGLDGHAAY